MDDGSQDATQEILKRLSDRNGNLRVLYNQKNMGSGASLWRGFREARGEYVISNFADRPFNVEELPAFMKIFNSGGVGFIVGVRKNRSANSLFRKGTSLLNFFVVRALFGLHIGDFQFVQMYKKEIIDKMHIISKHTFAAPEMIIKALSLGYRYEEYHTDFHPRPGGKAKYSNFPLILRSAWEILGFFWRWEVLDEKAKFGSHVNLRTRS